MVWVWGFLLVGILSTRGAAGAFVYGHKRDTLTHLMDMHGQGGSALPSSIDFCDQPSRYDTHTHRQTRTTNRQVGNQAGRWTDRQTTYEYKTK